MFKINPAPTVLVNVPFGSASVVMGANGPVEVIALGDAQPKPIDEATTLQLVCRFMDRDDRKMLLHRFTEVGTNGLTNGVLFAEVVQSWNVVEDDGTAVPLSVANIDRLLGNFEELGEQMLANWVRACVEVRAKN
jgi:hypothetical protein